MNDFQFEFRGIKTTGDLETYVLGIFQRIRERAPYGASLRGCLEKIGEAYQGTVDIQSREGAFLAKALGSSPREAIRELELGIRARFSEWHKRRFRPALT